VDDILQVPFSYRLGGLFALGVVVGSVVNWAAHRLAPSHRGVNPWSTAGAGASSSTWFDCIPVLGWLFIRRRPEAGGGFWLRALAVELGMGALYATLYWWMLNRMGLVAADSLPATVTPTESVLATIHLQFAGLAVLAALLVAATLIDFDDQVIPDAVTVPGTLLALLMASIFPRWLLPQELNLLISGQQRLEFMTLSSPAPWPARLNGLGDNSPYVVGLLCWLLWCFALLPRHWRGRKGLEMALAIFWGRISRDPYSWVIGVVAAAGAVWIWLIWDLGPPHWQGLLSSLIGMTVSAGLVWAVRLIGGKVMQQEAMGFGDVTLMAMIGAALGWQAGLMVFLLAPVVALVFGLVQVLASGKGQIPFGPFLCIAAIGLIFGWGQAWPWASPIFAMFYSLGWMSSFLVIAGFLVALAGLLAFVMRIKSAFQGSAAAPPPTPEGPANSRGVT
jgi:prepilin signal peptidase PulO-like enzyme (type II secretory pathway)